jgi:RNA-directed DNA polymerase
MERVRMAARRDREAQFTALMHHITIDRLRAAFAGMNRKAAAGVDGETWDAYAKDLEARLEDLHGRIQRGGYWVSPARRTYIPKAGGGRRPLGIATLEDKIVQRAVSEVMEAIYEVDFLGFSYGFRRGRHQHQALDAVTYGIERRKVNWVLDTDIKGFFDAIDHDRLRELLGRRIGDKRLLRLIDKMLVAGVMEGDEWRRTDRGSAQGSALSPLLANVYLHYVFDVWAHEWRQRNATGEVYLVRYADDIIVMFQRCGDAKRFQRELAQRLSKYELELHPGKTRLIEFGRFAAENRAMRGQRRPETFDFLGFTHLCGRTRKGGFTVRRTSMQKRMTAKLKEIKETLKRRRHRPIEEQGRWLAAVMRGWFNYHAVPGNQSALSWFYFTVSRHWLRALRRRSQKHRLPWSRFKALQDQFLPKPRVLHDWPSRRFDQRLTQGRSPVR